MQQNNSNRSSFPFLSAELLTKWLGMLVETIVRMVTGERSHPEAPPPMTEGSRATRMGSSLPATPRRTLVSYINVGIYKVERARRISAMVRQYQNALRTIKMTRRAIRRAPRQSRSLFSGYYRVLQDARRRVKMLHAQMRHTENHLREYNPYAMEDEIRMLERRFATTDSPASRAEIELTLESRRQLLDTVLALDDRLADLAHQLNAITAALELNHVRIIAIAGRAGYTSEASMLSNRMHEVSEQLMLLEESLRELDER